MTVTTKNSNYTRHIVDGEEVFPCRCGKTHQGFHAQEDWAMHECLHDDDLLLFDPAGVICPQCGQSWCFRD
mgnify:CR=1 FL=1